MLIAVFSDSHDNALTLEKAIAQVKARGISHGFHLGDFCSDRTLVSLGQSGITWQGVWGNNDDPTSGYRLLRAYPTVDISEESARELTINGQHLFLTHYPPIARTAALSGMYDAVLYGHNHRAAVERVTVENKSVLLANPGEIFGRRTSKPSFGIYNSEQNDLEIIWLQK